MKRIAAVRNQFLMLICASLVGLSAAAAGAEEGGGITVSGSGAVEAMPDAVELTATVEGNAELAGDAVEKYRGSKRRVVEAIKGLGIKGISVTGAGLALNSGNPVNPLAALQGQANQPKAADKVAVQEHLTITLSGIDSMSADELLQSLTRIVDAVKDAGVSVGPTSPQSVFQVQFTGGKPGTLATFKLTNVEALRQQAYEAALKQARAKAERLAQLAGVQLGDIASIRETVPVAKDDDNNNNSGGIAAFYAAMFGASSGSPAEYTSAELQKIPVTVSLSVQFEIAGK